MRVERWTREGKTSKERKENVCKSTAASPPHLSHPQCPLQTAVHLGGNFPTSVAARKSFTAWLHSSMDNCSEICMCRHLPAVQPVAFPTPFGSAFCSSPHWLQRQRRCARVKAAVRPLPLHQQHLPSSQCPNRNTYVSIAAFPFSAPLNHVANDFTHVLGTDLSLPALPFSLYM